MKRSATTPGAKAASRGKRNPNARLDWLDEASECCRTLATLAGLLEACGRQADGQPIRPEVLAHAGALMEDEVEALRGLLERWRAAGRPGRDSTVPRC